LSVSEKPATLDLKGDVQMGEAAPISESSGISKESLEEVKPSTSTSKTVVTDVKQVENNEKITESSELSKSKNILEVEEQDVEKVSDTEFSDLTPDIKAASSSKPIIDHKVNASDRKKSNGITSTIKPSAATNATSGESKSQVSISEETEEAKVKKTGIFLDEKNSSVPEGISSDSKINKTKTSTEDDADKSKTLSDSNETLKEKGISSGKKAKLPAIPSSSPMKMEESISGSAQRVSSPVVMDEKKLRKLEVYLIFSISDF